MPHDVVPDRGFSRLFEEVVTHSDDLRDHEIVPIAILHIVVVVLAILFIQTLQNSDGILCGIVKILIDKIVKGFHATIEYLHHIDRLSRW